MGDELHWQHVIVEGLFVMLPILFAQWFAHRDTLKKGAERDQRMNFVLTEHVPHTHGEKHGPLQAENISFPRVRVNGELK